MTHFVLLTVLIATEFVMADVSTVGGLVWNKI